MSRPATKPGKLAYTFNEGAAVTGLSAKTLRRLGNAGRIVLSKPPGVNRTLIMAESIDRLLEAGKLAAVNG